MIDVEVAYGTPQEQVLFSVSVPQGCTLEEAVRGSGLLERFPALNLDTARVGIFSRPANLDTVLEEGDRVEIYRPLLVDPKEARRRRANQRIRS